MLSLPQGAEACSVVVNDRLDEAPVVVQKQAHGLRDLLYAVVAVGDELFGLDTAAGDELGHAAQEQPPAAAARL